MSRQSTALLYRPALRPAWRRFLSVVAQGKVVFIALPQIAMGVQTLGRGSQAKRVPTCTEANLNWNVYSLSPSIGIRKTQFLHA